jgi:hypothetical protein
MPFVINGTRESLSFSLGAHFVDKPLFRVHRVLVLAQVEHVILIVRQLNPLHLQEGNGTCLDSASDEFLILEQRFRNVVVLLSCLPHDLP